MHDEAVACRNGVNQRAEELWKKLFHLMSMVPIVESEGYFLICIIRQIETVPMVRFGATI